LPGGLIGKDSLSPGINHQHRNGRTGSEAQRFRALSPVNRRAFSQQRCPAIPITSRWDSSKKPI
jgi:hypothetical protein